MRACSTFLLLAVSSCCNCPTASESAHADETISPTVVVGAAASSVQDTAGAANDETDQPPATYVDKLKGTEVSFKMVWIPEGNFWIGEREVTWDEYEPYCDFDVEKETVPPGVDAVAKPSKPLETFPYDREWGKGRRPAVGMSWAAAKKYCQWISLNTGHRYRLPSEKEWKLACGPAVPEDQLGEHAWYDENSDDMTHETGQKKPNQYGLYDMLGNLWEYTNEAYDPEQPEWALLKGGAWADFAEDATPDSRLMFDEFWNLDDPNVPPGVWWVPEGDHVGFRLLREGPKEKGAAEGEGATKDGDG